jgi:hypothetical protein
MNRRVVFGCLGVVAVLAAVALVFLYFWLLKPAQEVFADLEQLKGMQELNTQIAEEAVYEPPADGELTPEQLERFARVQREMRSALGAADYALLGERAQKLKGVLVRGEEVATESVGFRDAILAFKGLGPVLLRAKEGQVEGLNREGFSLPEYRWVRENLYRGLGFSRVNIYLEDFAASLGKGEYDLPEEEETVPPPPDRNLELVSLYSRTAREWFPFLVFGL